MANLKMIRGGRESRPVDDAREGEGEREEVRPRADHVAAIGRLAQVDAARLDASCAEAGRAHGAMLVDALGPARARRFARALIEGLKREVPGL